MERRTVERVWEGDHEGPSQVPRIERHTLPVVDSRKQAR